MWQVFRHRLFKRSSRSGLLTLAFLTSCISGLPPPLAHADDDPWPAIQHELYGSRQIREDDGIVILDAPERAEDAAVVPMSIRVPPTVEGQIKSMALVVDRNPAPVAATFVFGPSIGGGGVERKMSLRVRIDSFTYVHALVETADGVLHMTKAFVKASGGCSAPAATDSDTDMTNLGKMRIKNFDPVLASTPLREAQVMIKHPNINGMQMDLDTHGYPPALFIREVTVKQGDELVFKAETGISISTNPYFRFTYLHSKDHALAVTATDSEDAEFTGSSDKGDVSQ